MSRQRGLGVDNALRYEVALASGAVVTADACANPDLFWALRGGGGGAWGVVLSVWYRLWPKTPVRVFLMAYDAATYSTNPGAVVRYLSDHFVPFLVSVVRPARLDRRWGGYWSAACYANGIPGICLHLFFLGSEAAGRATLVDAVDTFLAGVPRDLVAAVRPGHSWQPGAEGWAGKAQYDSYIDYQAAMSAQDCAGARPPAACGRFNGIAADWTGNRAAGRPSSWLLPASFWEDDKERAIAVLRTAAFARGEGASSGYILGGAVNDVDVNATAVHPAMRAAAASIFGGDVDPARHTSSNNGMVYLREQVPDSAPCFNHDGFPLGLGAEPSAWKAAYWGQGLPRLEQVKAKFDPDGRFNVFQGVGYESPPAFSKAHRLPTDTKTCSSSTPSSGDRGGPAPTGTALVLLLGLLGVVLL